MKDAQHRDAIAFANENSLSIAPSCDRESADDSSTVVVPHTEGSRNKNGDREQASAIEVDD